MAADGSLNFNTKIDQSGFEKGTRTISSGISKLKGSLKSLAKTAASAMPFGKVGGVQKNINGLTSSLKGLAGVAAAAFSVKQILDFAKSSKEAYNVQIEQETKLATIMKQRMGATDDVIDSVKQLAAQQQKLGVIGDEVQLAGAQQVATFLTETDSIKTLLPAMNDLLAQQRGLEASTGDAVNIANLMGKVLQGQTSALKRVGISFSDAEEQVLKYGSESERAAMLAQVITNNVGRMNQALAQTDAGKQKQLANTMGDIKEQFGQAVISIESAFLPLLARLVDGFSKVASMAQTAASAIRSAFGVESDSNSATIAAATATSTAAAADSYADIEDSAEQTQKAQENSLASFDKVIKIGQNDTASGAGATAGGSSSAVGSKAIAQTTEKARTWADDLKDSLKKGNWDGIGKAISEKINKAVAKINWKGAGEKLGKGITNAFTFAYSFLKSTNWVGIGSGFANFLNGAIEKTSFDKVGRTFAAKTNAFIGLAWGFVKDFDFVGAGLGFADLINGWVDEFDASQLGDTISTAAKGILDFISISLKEIKWEKIGEKISDFINAIDWRGILTSLFDVIGNIIKATPKLLKGIISNLDFDNASALFAVLFAPKMAKSLLNFFRRDSDVKGTLTDAGKSAGNTVGDGFKGTAEATGSGFANKLASGLSAATSVINAAIVGWQIGSMIYQAAKPGIEKITDALTDAMNADKYVKGIEDEIDARSKKTLQKYKNEGFTGLTLDDVKNESQAFRKARKILELLNKYPQLEAAGYTATRILNDVSLYNDLLAGKLPKGVSSINSSTYIPTTSERIQESKINSEIEKLKKQYTNVPSDVIRKMARANLGLPALATGTVVPANYGRFAAILGDNRKEPEVVSPLSTMKQAVLEALAMHSQDNQKQPVTINISLDTRNGKRLLTKQIIDDINDIIVSTGKVPINI